MRRKKISNLRRFENVFDFQKLGHLQKKSANNFQHREDFKLYRIQKIAI